MIQLITSSLVAVPLLSTVAQRTSMKIEQKRRAQLEAMVLAEAGQIVSEELERISTVEEE